MTISMGETPARLFAHHLLAPLASCGLPPYLPPGGLPQVVGQDPPTYPPLHPFFSAIEARIEPKDASEDADPALDPRPKAEASPEPALLLVASSLLGELAALGQHHTLHPRLVSRSLVLGRIETPVCGQQERRSPEALPMGSQALGKVRAFRTGLGEDLVAAYDASVDFVQKNLATKLVRFSRLVAGDDLGVLLEEAQKLLGGRHLLAFEDTASGLVDPSLHQR